MDWQAVFYVLGAAAAVLVGVAAVIAATHSSHEGTLLTAAWLVTLIAICLIGGFVCLWIGKKIVLDTVVQYIGAQIKADKAPTLAVVLLTAVQEMLLGTGNEILNGHPLQRWLLGSALALVPLLGYLCSSDSAKARDIVIAWLLLLIPAIFVAVSAFTVNGWWRSFKLLSVSSRATVLGVVIVWIVIIAISLLAMISKRQNKSRATASTGPADA